MERRAFLTALAAAVVLRRLPTQEPFKLGRIYPSTATAELAKLMDENRRLVYLPRGHYKAGWSVTHEMWEDDLYGVLNGK